MIKMNEEEFEDFKNYIKKYRCSTNDLVNKYITPYTLEKFRQCDDNFDYEPDLYGNYNVLGKIDELQQRYKQLQNNWNELKKFVEADIKRWEDEEKKWIEHGFMKFGGEANNKIIFKKVLNKMQELEQGKDE